MIFMLDLIRFNRFFKTIGSLVWTLVIKLVTDTQALILIQYQTVVLFGHCKYRLTTKIANGNRYPVILTFNKRVRIQKLYREKSLWKIHGDSQ